VTAAGGQVGRRTRHGRPPGVVGELRDFRAARDGSDAASAQWRITIADVTGKIDFETTNGGVTLKRLAAQCTAAPPTRLASRARRLALGRRRPGRRNHQRRRAPDGPRQLLGAAGDGHGERRCPRGFPDQGLGRGPARDLHTLGSGGALIRLKTTNGGVSIGRGTV